MDGGGKGPIEDLTKIIIAEGAIIAAIAALTALVVILS